MASKKEIQHQNTDEEAVSSMNQKNLGADAGSKNRRALVDIGNRVTNIYVVDGKPIPQASRPVTRGFRAQLMANAQAATVAENNLKCNAVKLDVPVVKAAQGRKPTQKKATLKQEPEEVIDISPDTKEKEIQKMRAEKKRVGDVSARKQTPTFTATLTARSKAACGLSNKPKEQIVDIDAADVNNELAVVEYIDDMYKFYKLAETETRVDDYIDSQPEINERMRAILIDWLVEVHRKFELNQETLYLTINIVDRFLAKKTTSRKELQLVGIGSMLIASKYEEIWAPQVEDFVCMSDRAYSNKQVLVMEKCILGELEWYLTVPTPYVFLVRYIKASLPDSAIIKNLAYFLAELGMMNYETIRYCYSMIAASAVYAARCTVRKTPVWTETLKLHTCFSESQLMDCAKLLVSFHVAAASDGKLQVIHKKYSSTQRLCVALLPPAKSVLAATPPGAEPRDNHRVRQIDEEN